MKRNGFTIIEVLVAMMILTGAMVMLSNSTGSSVLMTRKGLNIETITFLTKRALTMVEIKYGGTQISNLPEGPEDHEFDEPEYKEFTWRLESKKMDFPDFSSVLTSQKGGVDDTTLMVVKQMVTKVSDAIKEVRVTIIRKIKGKTLEYPITTYMVDHSQATNLAGTPLAAPPPGKVGP